MAEKPSDDSLFTEPLSPLQQTAVVMHEQFSSFLHAGFTEEQAMAILLCLIETSMLNTEVDDD